MRSPFIKDGALQRFVPVVGVTLRSLEARRYQDVAAGSQIRIDHNSTISLVQPEGADRCRVEFGYTTSYGALGVVKMEGTLVWQDAKAGEAASEWSKTRNLPTDVAQQVHSAIMMHCVPQAVGLARDLRMPPPIPIPQVQFQKPAAQQPPAQQGYNPEVG